MPTLPNTRHRWLIAIVVILGVTLSIASYRFAHRSEQDRIHTAFQRRAREQSRLGQERLRLYEEMVYSLRHAFVGQEEVTRPEFARMCHEILRRHQGVQALQWVQLVTAEQRAQFERDESAALGRRFEIRERAGDNTLQPAGERAEYTVIRFVEPLPGNEAVLGYDNSTAPTRPQLLAARASGEPVVSPVFQLAQSRGPDGDFGIVFILPVHLTAPEAVTTEGGRFAGFIQGVFLIEQMLSSAHRLRPEEALDHYYIDLDAGPGGLPVLYASRAGRELSRTERMQMPEFPAGRSYEETISLPGRRWKFGAVMNPAWAAQQRTLIPLFQLGGGLVTTLVSAVLLSVLLRRTEEVQRQVEERTALLQRMQRDLEEDIARRAAAEQDLQASEERLEAFLDHSPAAIFVKDLGGRYVLCNPQFELICSRPREEILGRTDHQLFEAETAARFRENDQKVIASGEPQELEEYLDTEAGRRTSIVHKFPLRDTDGTIYALGGIATDITSRLEADRQVILLERELLQSQKLESLGVLAGGIAHDFNNLLTAVLGNASLARALLPPGHNAAEQLQRIEKAARRAADLCSQMLAYAGKGALVTGPVILSDLVRDTAALLEVSIGKGVKLRLDLAPELPPVLADPTQLRQIVMNLVLNASDAIGDKPGEVTIRTFAADCSKFDLGRAVQAPDLAPGAYVGIEISDSGCGMSPETISRIFEPFFTTKFSGRGLGLSAVLGIVRSHRGALFVESQPGEGSMFRLLLPAANVSAKPVFENQDAAADGSARDRLAGTVLVVDDEPQVREITAIALRTHGLEVLEAPDGTEALRCTKEHGEMIDLILLDLTMPGLSGEETLRRMRMQDRRQKVILMSGYSENDATRRCAQLGAVAFVHKPFELEHLLSVIRPHVRRAP